MHPNSHMFVDLVKIWDLSILAVRYPSRKFIESFNRACMKMRNQLKPPIYKDFNTGAARIYYIVNLVK